MLVVDPGSPATGAVFDPASRLVFAMSADNIDQVYVAGELKVKNGGLLGQDIAEIQRQTVARVEVIRAAQAQAAATGAAAD